MKEFNYSSLDDGTIKITKYLVSANVEIPSVINGKIVTTIGDYAFGYRWSISDRRRKVKKFHIYCYKNTSGEEYANNRKFDYTLLN